jgi:hypothetical protein
MTEDKKREKWLKKMGEEEVKIPGGLTAGNMPDPIRAAAEAHEIAHNSLKTYDERIEGIKTVLRAQVERYFTGLLRGEPESVSMIRECLDRIRQGK